MRPTKIVATVGPASCSAEVLGRFIDEGVDVLRFNMSHGSHADHGRALDAAREAADGRGAHIAVMADLCGPKVRTGPIDPQAARIDTGDECRIVSECLEGSARRFGTNHAGFVDDVQVGHRVFIDDGQIRLRVVDKSGHSLVCTCDVGGTIGTRKGINVPDSTLSLPSITEKDRVDLAWAIENQVDFVALSFVRRAEDVELLRTALKEADSDIPILAKIETPQAIQAIDEIIAACDVVLVARGDLGVEMDVTQVPMLQKDIVVRCRRAGKPVIIATQMLQSMVDQPSPTRAEVSDVANAALDGADAVMLSAESATGRYPVQAVAMMSRICEQVRSFAKDHEMGWSDILSDRLRVGFEIDRTTSAVARSAAMVAHDLGAKLIVVWCRTGRTARWLSKYRVHQPLAALSSNAAVCRRLGIVYGISSMLVSQELTEGRTPWDEMEAKLVERYGLEKSDIIVVVGDPTGPAKACTISIRLVGH